MLLHLFIEGQNSFTIKPNLSCRQEIKPIRARPHRQILVYSWTRLPCPQSIASTLDSYHRIRRWDNSHKYGSGALQAVHCWFLQCSVSWVRNKRDKLSNLNKHRHWRSHFMPTYVLATPGSHKIVYTDISHGCLGSEPKGTSSASSTKWTLKVFLS